MQAACAPSFFVSRSGLFPGGAPAVIFALAFVLNATYATPAQAQIYKCTDREGSVTYSNVKRQPGHRCEHIALDPLNAAGKRTRSSKGGKRYAVASPANFPKVSKHVQRSRDHARLNLLRREHAHEQEGLDQARLKLEAVKSAEISDQKSILSLHKTIERHQRNLHAINHELSRLR